MTVAVAVGAVVWSATVLLCLASIGAAHASVLSQVNDARRGAGVRVVKPEPHLNHSAAAWTRHMLATGSFNHGHSITQRIAKSGYPEGGKWSGGENIAWRTFGPSLVERILRVPHCRKVLLDPRWRDVGIGLGSGTYSAATIDFGRSR